MTAAHVADVLREAEQRGFVNDVDSAVILYDLDVLERQVRRVTTSFPDDAWHAVAVKSNPLMCVLRALADMNVFAEAASAEEMAVARAAGFGARIVWDSPAKTVGEIQAALSDPPDLVNVDSFAELDRYPSGGVRLGLRINPERLPDTISALATGVVGSKFGVPISQRERIHDAYAAEPRLTAIHVHSGSDSRSLEPMVEAVAAVVELADEINARPATKQRIETVDIGGTALHRARGRPALRRAIRSTARRTSPSALRRHLPHRDRVRPLPSPRSGQHRQPRRVRHQVARANACGHPRGCRQLRP